MKNFLAVLMVAMVALTAGISEAEAKRLGGGGAIGRQSHNAGQQVSPAYQQTARPNQAAPASPQSAQPKPASPWKNILGGALLGLGLGALLSHLGLGGLASGIGSLLMLALLIGAGVFIYRMLRRQRHAGAMQPAFAGGGATAPEIGSRIEPTALQSLPSSSGGASPAWGIPADFDSAAFLHHAKTSFIRLQAAWDKADVNDLREFTTPEMFAELKMQLQERGASPNNTDVVSLDAELLGIETIGDEYLASVKFSGTIKESENAPAAPFTEIWNLAKPVSGGGWLLAGIQQIG
ncbi:MAG TPA: Tim44-like domain-containing protein [Paucimonas sp.]|nr:Tim44-like domain-containing protein [Paucimonas sp.]